MTTSEWGFTDAEDALRYLGEVRRLWLLWLAAVLLLMSAPGPSMVFTGLGVAVLLVVVLRPIQRRASRIVPYNTVPANRRSPRWGRVTARDQVLRHLIYGEAPLVAATEMTGRSPSRWLLGRRVVMAATIVAFGLILLGVATGWDVPSGRTT